MDVTEYLSETQLREIAIEEWRRMCHEACKGSAERIIGNIAHDVAVSMVAESLGDDANELIREKAIKAIDGLSPYTVFHAPDVWDRGPSPAYTVLMDAVRANRPLVEKRMGEVIHQLTKREAVEILKSGTIQINPGKAPGL